MKFIIIYLFSFFVVGLNLFSQCEKIDNSKYPTGFVDVKSVDSTLIMDIRYNSIHNFIGDTIDGYLCSKCILSEQAAIALSKVQTELRKYSLSLKIYDCYRPQKAVDNFVRWAENIDDKKMRNEFYPKVDKTNLFKDGYIASKSGHSRGSTVDLTIISLPVQPQAEFKENETLSECTNGVGVRFKDNSIDMGTGFDCFSELSHTLNNTLTGEQKANRALLRTMMEKYGFKNYELEWWHFTLVDEPFNDTYFNFDVK